ncbi:MAG TPA: PQQ-binding-like beta-propeller repeat protein [Verrucomicrobiae bacterium]|nr:PQQ-binding-like beta-propeller repeat protein [Verrucomicrobiae bacterium]
MDNRLGQFFVVSPRRTRALGGGALAAGTLIVSLLATDATTAAPVRGWLSWRGPEQTGVSRETGLPDKVSASDALWVADFPGASAPVVANGRLYAMGYIGKGADLQEGVTCFDAESGKQLWQQLYDDYLSDIIYNRYATSSPEIDPETGNVYIQGTQGIFAGFTADGQPIWHHSLMEEFGRLTFPNGRTASPAVDHDLVITRGITANWGTQGPASDRFYGFDKKTGDLVWASTPGAQPKDNSFSHPYFGWYHGQRVFYSAIGDGSVACVNARTGEPLWRVNLFRAGVNATVLVHKDDKVIAIYGTPYELGQMVALKIPNVEPTNSAAGPVVLERKDLELWSQDISSSTSSPILADDTIYMVAEKGDLFAVDAASGTIKWKLKLGIEQRNSCPLYADGKLYVPILDDPETKSSGEADAGTKGAFYIIKPEEHEGKILCHAVLDGRCFGTPTAYNGKLYLQTARHLYCWGKQGDNAGCPAPLAEKPWPAPGKPTQLLAVPSEVLLHPGQKATFRVRALDANGLTVQEDIPAAQIHWRGYIPATAKVKASMKGTFDASGELVAAPDPIYSAGAYEAEYQGLKGYIRGRVMPNLPIKQDFESFTLSETNREGTPFSYPPLPWIGARFKFDVRDLDGNKVMAKTTDNRFFQRAMMFIGTPEMKNYTIQADVMSDGNRRKMSEVGVINQHYAIVLKGNEQKLEINSNQDRLRVAQDFKWSPKVWYRLKARVDRNADGSAVVRAKAWKRDESEPGGWTIEVPHKTAHQQGCPGLFGFSPQDMRVYIDNIEVTSD